MKPDGDEGIRYSKLITIAIHIAAKSGGRFAGTLCLFICGTNNLKALFSETYLCKYIYRMDKYENVVTTAIVIKYH